MEDKIQKLLNNQEKQLELQKQSFDLKHVKKRFTTLRWTLVSECLLCGRYSAY